MTNSARGAGDHAPSGPVDSSHAAFSWDWVEDAIWYEIHVRLENPHGGRIWASCWVQDVLAFMPAVDLVGHRGQWRIRACGLDGVGLWSHWFLFEATSDGDGVEVGDDDDDDDGDGDEDIGWSGGIDNFEIHFDSVQPDDPPWISSTVADVEAGQILLMWDSEPGKTYKVYGCTNLAEGHWSPLETMQGDGTELHYRGANDAGKVMFYRLGAE